MPSSAVFGLKPVRQYLVAVSRIGGRDDCQPGSTASGERRAPGANKAITICGASVTLVLVPKPCLVGRQPR